MDRVLIDTDIILDFFFDRLPFSESAEKILILCENKEIEGYVTPVIMSNLFYLLKKTAKRDKVIENLINLIGIVDVLNMNKEVVINSLYSEFKDFEDSLQYFSALNFGKINYIISRNIKDYKYSSIKVMTADEYINEYKFTLN